MRLSSALLCRPVLRDWLFQTTTQARKMATKPIKVDWQAPVPCAVGDLLAAIDTPCLLVDLDAMEYNLKALPRMMSVWPGVATRPHMKAHKTPALAALQLGHGAIGVCCQTLTEAEAMVYSGVAKDVLISNQVIGKKKLQRVAALTQHAKMSVCVDDVGNVDDISDVCVAQGCSLDVVVEVDVGHMRCGVQPGLPVVALAQHVLKRPNITFKGIQCYHGKNQHIRTTDDRSGAVANVVQLVTDSLKLLKEQGIDCGYVTGGGTGTFPYEAASGVFTEVQPGSYLFMDVDYCKNYNEKGEFFNDFKNSLFVLTTVQSASGTSKAVVDAGLKALSCDSGQPTVCGHDDMVYQFGGDEHGKVTPADGLKVGDLLRLIPGHCDPTVNLYDWVVGVRGDAVETVWPVMARNPGV